MFISLLYSLSHGVTGVAVVALALFFMFLALIRMSGTWMFLAFLLTIPYTYTSGDWYGGLLFIRLLPLTQLLAAFFIEKEETMLAWVSSLPTIGTLLYALYTIAMRQDIPQFKF